MSGRRIPRPTPAGASARRRASVPRRLADAMTLPACVGLLAPVALLGAVILVGGLAYRDLVHAVFLAPDAIIVALASALFLGLWVRRRLSTAVLAGAGRATALRAAGLLTVRVVAVCLAVWAAGQALFLVFPGHDPLSTRRLLEQVAWVLVAGTGLLWTGILASAVSERWGWPRTALVGLVCWALLDSLPEGGAWIGVRPWLDGDVHALGGIVLTVLAVVLGVHEVRCWEPER